MSCASACRLSVTVFVLFFFCLISAASHAAPQCGESTAYKAFNVVSLKSELMVTALSCNAQQRYNGFIYQFRGTLLDQEENLHNFFKRSYGKSAQKAYDDFITQLANVQSHNGLQSGTIFCQQRISMFDELSVLDTAEDLSFYAEAKDIMQPASYQTCNSYASNKIKSNSANP